MEIADGRPPDHAKTRTWLWASLTVIVFFGAGLATIAWASEDSATRQPLSGGVTTTGVNSPTGTITPTKPGTSKSTPPETTVSGKGDVTAIAVVGDSLSVQSTSDQHAMLQQAGWWPIVVDAEHLRRIPSDSSTKPPYSGIAAVRAIRKQGTDPHTWVVELGTNDVGTTGNNSLKIVNVINVMLREIGPGHRVVWVNIFQGQQPERTATFNHVLEEIAAARSDITIADWADVAEKSGYLIDDHVHLTAKGARAFAGVIATAAGSPPREG